MDCIIFTEGGHEQGYGHIERCKSLYDELKKRGRKVIFCIYTVEDIKTVLTGYEYVVFDWLHNEFSFQGESACIVDSYLAHLEKLTELSEKFSHILWIDDNNRIDYPRGVVVNPSFFGANLLYPKNKNINYLLGQEYTLLRKEFFKKPNKTISPTIGSVLITLGGSDILNLTPKILLLLNRHFPHFIKQVVIGNGFTHMDEIHTAQDEKTVLHYNADASTMSRMMEENDFIISAAGQTVHEIVQKEIPALLLCVIDNQILNFEWMIHEGLAAGIELPAFENSLISAVKGLTFSKRQMMSEKMKKIDLSKGSKNIINALEGD